MAQMKVTMQWTKLAASTQALPYLNQAQQGKKKNG